MRLLGQTRGMAMCRQTSSWWLTLKEEAIQNTDEKLNETPMEFAENLNLIY